MVDIVRNRPLMTDPAFAMFPAYWVAVALRNRFLNTKFAAVSCHPLTLGGLDGELNVEIAGLASLNIFFKHY